MAKQSISFSRMTDTQWIENSFKFLPAMTGGLNTPFHPGNNYSAYKFNAAITIAAGSNHQGVAIKTKSVKVN